MSTWYTCEQEIYRISLYVQPGAKQTEIVGLHDQALKIRLATPPIEGRANEALLKFIAALFEVPVRQVKLKHGHTSRSKVLIITGSSIHPERIYPVQ